MTHLDATAVPRQDYYGDKRQPWDDILDSLWAPEFAAANVLKYLRRVKKPEHSLESAKWYHARLIEMMRGELIPATLERLSHRDRHAARASAVLVRLGELLTDDEKVRLG